MLCSQEADAEGGERADGSAEGGLCASELVEEPERDEAVSRRTRAGGGRGAMFVRRSSRGPGRGRGRQRPKCGRRVRTRLAQCPHVDLLADPTCATRNGCDDGPFESVVFNTVSNYTVLNLKNDYFGTSTNSFEYVSP